MGLDETARLFHAASEGDDEAWNSLLERLRPRLVLWAGTRLSADLRAKMEPEDVVQDTLIKVQRDRVRVQAFEWKAFLGWIFTVAENTIRDLAAYHDAYKRRPPREPFDLFASQASPSAEAARHEQLARVYRAVKRLSDDHRIVIRLRHIEALDVADVAKIMGRTVNAVGILYSRALKELRQILGEAGRGGPDGSSR